MVVIFIVNVIKIHMEKLVGLIFCKSYVTSQESFAASSMGKPKEKRGLMCVLGALRTTAMLKKKMPNSQATH